MKPTIRRFIGIPLQALLILSSSNLSFTEEPGSEPSPDRFPKDTYAPVVELAQSDATPEEVIARIRETPDLDPELVFLIFEDLDSVRHLRILHEIVRDESLANRFVFNSLSLVPTPSFDEIDRKEVVATLDEIDSFASIIIEARNQAVISLLGSAPEEVPPVLLVPALFALPYSFGVIHVLGIQLSPHEFPHEVDLPAAESLWSLNDLPLDRIPVRYHEIVNLSSILITAKTENGDPAECADALDRISDLLNESDIPLSIRIAYAGVAHSSLGDCLNDSLRIQTASWLAEAWEKGIPVDFLTSDSRGILNGFLVAHGNDGWKATAKRLIDHWPGDQGNGGRSLSWLVGVAALLGEKDTATSLLSELPKWHPPLAQDPSLGILVGCGFHEIAAQQIALRKNELLRENDFARDARYGRQLESQVSSFLQKIPDTEVRFLTELHLKIPEDSRTDPPTMSRNDRLKELALRTAAFPFKTSEAKLTALRLIGNFPDAASEIADVYIQFAQFDRVDRHLSSFSRADEWAELVEDTLEAVILAEHFDDAQAIVDRIATSTSRVRNDFHRDEHAEVWELVADEISNHLSPPDQISPRLLPTARTVAGLPRNYFPLKFNHARGQLIQKNLAAHHASEEGTAEWWDWYGKLPPLRRVEHDTSLIQHLLGKDRLEMGPGSWNSEEARQLKPDPDVVPYLDLVEVFTTLAPGNHTSEDRVSALLSKIGPDTPIAIRVIHDYRYLSGNEILNNADLLVEAFPEDCKEKWWDLTRIAEKEGRPDLAARFRAHQSFP